VTETAKKTSDASTAAAGRIDRAGAPSGTVKLLTWLRGSTSYGAVVRKRDGLARACPRPQILEQEGEPDGREHHRQEDHDRHRLRAGLEDLGLAWPLHLLHENAVRVRALGGLLISLEIRLEPGRPPQGELHRVERRRRDGNDVDERQRVAAVLD